MSKMHRLVLGTTIVLILLAAPVLMSNGQFERKRSNPIIVPEIEAWNNRIVDLSRQATRNTLEPAINDEELKHDLFSHFKRVFDRKYSSAEEENRRFALFVDTLSKVVEHNSKFMEVEIHTVTKFADRVSLVG